MIAVLRGGLFAIPVLFLLLASVWSLAAVWIDGRDDFVAWLALVGGVVAAVLIARRPLGLGTKVAAGVLPFLFVLGWWLSIDASNDREWLSDVARLPKAEIDGDRLVVRNVRNFAYVPGGEEIAEERWETRAWDLSKLEGVDLYMSYWGSPMIAHTIASWDFGDAPPLAISIETRKEVGEAYSAVLGFFRQFELYYVVADERDVVGVRTNHRGETVRLYRTTAKPELAKAILLDYLAEINALHEEPVWYNAASHNCTTTIRHHVRHVAQGHPFDYRILVNGRLDELGYERGNVDTRLPFEELRERSDIGERARTAAGRPDFSTSIREGLPNPR